MVSVVCLYRLILVVGVNYWIWKLFFEGIKNVVLERLFFFVMDCIIEFGSYFFKGIMAVGLFLNVFLVKVLIW